jgi:hypothetical protein
MLVLFTILTGTFLIKKMASEPEVTKRVIVDVGNEKEPSEGEPLHGHDPVKEMEDQEEELQHNEALVIGDLSFTDFTQHPQVVIENTAPVLLGASKTHLLIKAYSGLVYLHDLESNKNMTVTQFSDYAVLTDDHQYVLFTKYNDPVGKTDLVLFAHNLDSNLQDEVASIPDGLTVESIIYKEGIVSYIERDMNYTKVETKEAVLADFRSDLPNAAIREKRYPDIEDGLIIRNGVKYGYSHAKQKIFTLHSNDKASEFASIPDPQSINFASSFDVNDEGDWLVVYTNADGTKDILRTKDGIIDAFRQPTQATYLSSTTLLVHDSSHLYLYDTKTKEKTEFLSKVARYDVFGDVISLQTITGDIRTVHYSKK